MSNSNVSPESPVCDNYKTGYIFDISLMLKK